MKSVYELSVVKWTIKCFSFSLEILEIKKKFHYLSQQNVDKELQFAF